MGVDFLPARRNLIAAAGGDATSRSAEALAPATEPRSEAMDTDPPIRPGRSAALAPGAAPAARPSAEVFVPRGALFGDQSAGPTDDAASASQEVEFKPLPRLPGEQARDWLARLRERYERDAPHSKFVTDHHSIVFGEGDPLARLMFIGEAPGAEEDKVGRPFVGRAGQLLDKMIIAMGLKRESVYITNVLKTRPPNNATPTFDEAAACAPYLFEQIAIVRPEVIVTLGLPATRLLLHTAEAMSRLRGRWSGFTIPSTLPHPETLPPISPAVIPVMPTYHPAFLLRSYTTENRQRVWSDLLMVVDRLGLPKPTAGSVR